MSTIYGVDDIADFCVARDSGERVEITKELYWYFCEVLPRQSLFQRTRLGNGKDPHTYYVDFGFAEGWERITAFFRSPKSPAEPCRYYAQITPHWNTQ